MSSFLHTHRLSSEPMPHLPFLPGAVGKCPPLTHSHLSGSQPLTPLQNPDSHPSLIFSLMFRCKDIPISPSRKKKSLLLPSTHCRHYPISPSPNDCEQVYTVAHILTTCFSCICSFPWCLRSQVTSLWPDPTAPWQSTSWSASSAALGTLSTSWFLVLLLFGLILLNFIGKVHILQSSFQTCIFPDSQPHTCAVISHLE